MTDHGANFIMALALVLGCLYGVYASADWPEPQGHVGFYQGDN